MTACYQLLSGALPDLAPQSNALLDRLRDTRLPASTSLINGDYGLSFATVAEATGQWIEWLGQPPAAPVAGHHDCIEVNGTLLHVSRFAGTGSLPLLLVHGWPTSFLMFHRVVEELRVLCSELVLVSMPGFGTSPLPHVSWSTTDTARLLIAAMTMLGHERHVVHGEDWGSVVARSMGQFAPERVAGVHVSAGLAGFMADGTVEDNAWHDLQKYAAKGTSYLRLQAERPDSLAFGLSDSPVGLLAWHLDKFSLWQGELGDDFGVGMDFIFANATLYWLTNSAATSMRLYATSNQTIPKELSRTPTAVSVFGAADFSSYTVAQRYNNIVAWYEHSTGGGHGLSRLSRRTGDRLDQFHAPDRSALMNTPGPIILLGGGGLGPWVWARVTPLLENEGFTVVTPQLRTTGNDKTDAATVGLSDWIDDLADELSRHRNATLVAHSFAGYVAAGAISRTASNLRNVIFLDAVLPRPDMSWFHAVGTQTEGYMRSMADGGATPWFTRDQLDQMYPDNGISDTDFAWMHAHVTPQPIDTYSQPAIIEPMEILAEEVSLHYVKCLRTNPPVASINGDMPAWTVSTIDSSHWPMITAPSDTARHIIAVIERT